MVHYEEDEMESTPEEDLKAFIAEVVHVPLHACISVCKRRIHFILRHSTDSDV